MWHLGYFLPKWPLEHERRTRGSVPPTRKDKYISAEGYVKLVQSLTPEENMFSSQVIVNILSVCIVLHKGSLDALFEAKFEALHRTSPSAMAAPGELVMLEAAPRTF